MNTLNTESEFVKKMMALRPAIEASHERSNRIALLEHARMGRQICISEDGKVVWLQPAQVFAHYGLDEFGREIAPSANQSMNSNKNRNCNHDTENRNRSAEC